MIQEDNKDKPFLGNLSPASPESKGASPFVLSELAPTKAGGARLRLLMTLALSVILARPRRLPRKIPICHSWTFGRQSKNNLSARQWIKTWGLRPDQVSLVG